MYNHKVRAFMLTGASLFVLTLAHAQESDSPAVDEVAANEDGGELALNRITVTAQRREQSLIEVPVSVTAFSTEDITDYDIQDLNDYAALTPNFGITDGGSPLSRAISIRGVSDIGGTVPPISIFVDEFNTTATNFGAAFDVNLLDIERIEVLRGPQGTLFGRNVSGGAVSITTVKPSTEGFEGYVSGELGSFDHRLVRGAVNVPLGESVAVRVSAYGQERGEFIDNVGPSGRGNDLESYGVRGALRVRPGVDTIADLTVTYTDFEQGASDQVPTGQLSDFLRLNGFPVDPFGSYDEIGFFPSNDDTITTDGVTQSARETLIVTGQLEHDFGQVTAVFTAGYMDLDVNEQLDADFTPSNFFVFPGDTVSGSTWSVEPRLLSNGDGPLQWQIGASYAEDESTFLSSNVLGEDLLVGLFGLPPGTTDVVVEDSITGAAVNTTSVFGDLTYSVNDRLDVSFGLRYANDEVTESFIENPVFDIFQGVPTTGSSASGESSFETISGRLSATYDLNDSNNLFANIALGTRPGGFNTEAASNPDLPSTYGEEEVWNYEIGLKGRLFQDRLLYSVAAYYLDWSDLQNNTVFFVPGTVDGFNITTSAGGAESYGLEFEVSADLGAGFQLDAGFGLQDAEFGEFQTVDGAGDPFDASGNDIPLVSDVTANAALGYERQLTSNIDGFARAEASYRSDYFESALNSPLFGDSVDGYETVNLRIGFETDILRVSLAGENLTNDRQNVGFLQGTAGPSREAPTVLLFLEGNRR
ncbi:MAG: TonB-dependent receptor, partial [Pseudomonadota bacterium]